MKLLIAPALALASPAMAQTAPNDQAAANANSSAPAKIESEHKICRNAPRTSSRISKKICKTAAEWRESDKLTDGANNIVRNP